MAHHVITGNSIDVDEPIAPPDQREFWDRWHEDHDYASDEDFAETARRQFLASLRRDTPDSRAQRMLEIGCGQGRDAILLAGEGLDVVALDHSSVALDRASAAQPEHVSIKWDERDYADGLKYPDAHFDGVYSHLSLHYLNETATSRLFDDIARVLIPGGWLLFTVRSVADELYGRGQKLGDGLYCHGEHVRYFFSVGYIEKLLHGWSDVKIEQYIALTDNVNPGVFIRALARRPEHSTR